MSKRSKNKDNTSLAELNQEVMERMQIPFTRDKDEVWASLTGNLNEHTINNEKKIRIPVSLYVAASLLVILTIGSLFLRYHSISLDTKNQMSNITLPDGSTVEAKSNTQISYYPYWWKVKREVKLSGEAYFEVEKGNSFQVTSSAGVTEVLGTTFTVVARSDQYRVSCFTGSVSVKAVNSDVHATLMANEEVLVDKKGNYNVRLIESIDNIDNQKSIEKLKYFVYNSTSINEVFGEIESSYKIKINVPATLNFSYSGNLSRDLDINDILTAICIPFDIEYVQISDKEYNIIP